MKEYYENRVKQEEVARKFIIDGIKAELFALSNNADTDIKPEDLEFYSEIIEKADSDLQFAKNSLSGCFREEKNA